MTIMPLSPTAAPASERMPFTSVYRMQFNREFTFRQAAALVDYLRRLGISHCYASPILTARQGSRHGYDMVDPTTINAELGGEAGLRALSARLRDAGLGLLLDIVPNHMCVIGGRNAWWDDVLTHGRASPYARFFDIDWNPPAPGLVGKVLVPVLAERFVLELERGRIAVDWVEGEFRVCYFEHRWPLAPRSWRHLLAPLLRRARARGGVPERHLAELTTLLHLASRWPAPAIARRAHSARRRAAWDALRRRLQALFTASERLRSALQAELQAINGVTDDGSSFARLEKLLDEQAYRLCHWRMAAEDINYRRFLDINELAGLRMEDPVVFQATHARVLALVAEGVVQGLRIDHPDGLANPGRYLRALRRALERRLKQAHTPGAPPREARDVVLLAEKILEPKEQQRPSWPIQGGTGYDFLQRANGILVDTHQGRRFHALYLRCTGVHAEFPALTHACKHLWLRTAMAADVRGLVSRLARLAANLRDGRDYPFSELRAALCEVIACLPVYRTYVSMHRLTASPQDRHWILAALRIARARTPELPEALLKFVGRLLLEPALAVRVMPEEWRGFVTRFQQLCGAAMSKGLEDTVYYRAFPLASLNEIGGDPGHFGVTLGQFHLWNQGRAQDWPRALSATATHDTKRGEDMRARINVLSEMPEAWQQAFLRWQAMNARHKTAVAGLDVPDANTEYLLYQTLVGAWPLAGTEDGDWADFPARIAAYMEKAVREAQLHTSWINANAPYEAALGRFVQALLEPAPDNPFPRDMEAFLDPLVAPGLYNGLSQTLLKIASPGVPDFYQGTELWDFSLVDPDNRRPVDFHTRQTLLRALERSTGDQGALATDLLAQARDGRVKLFVTMRGLRLRNRLRELFGCGDYRPLKVDGVQAAHCVAFARTYRDRAVIAAVGRLYLELLGSADAARRLPVGPDVWADTDIEPAPELAAGRYRDAFTQRIVTARTGGERGRLAVGDVFSALPVALLERVA